MEHRNGREDTVLHSDDEVRVLLERLHVRQGLLDDACVNDERQIVTVEDIAEATGMSVEFVAEELERMHREMKEAKLVGALRELEESTHRVERATPQSHDRPNPLFTLRSVRELMDRNQVRPVFVRRASTKNANDSSHLVLRWLGVIFLLLMIGLIVKMIFAGP